MIVIKPAKKLKTKKDMFNPENWAIVYLDEPSEHFGIGFYRACPCCAFPTRLSDEESKKIKEEVERELRKEDLKKIEIPESPKLILP